MTPVLQQGTVWGYAALLTDRSHEEVQCARTITRFLLIIELLPFVNFLMDFCLGHNFQSIEASNFKLHTQIDHIKDKRSVQESLLYSIFFGVISICKF